MHKPAWSKRLVCSVVSLSYDFTERSGRLNLPTHECCDMAGAIEMFTAIDPKVQSVQTYSGKEPDTLYARRGAEWMAIRPRDFLPRQS